MIHRPTGIQDEQVDSLDVMIEAATYLDGGQAVTVVNAEAENGAEVNDIGERMAAVKAPWRRFRSSLPAGKDADLSQALSGQVRAARDGAVLARAMVCKDVDPAVARKQVAALEHRGDEMRSDFVDRLSRTLVTPVDREDLFRLSRSIDDVLDTIRDFVREADLYQIEKRSSYRPLVECVVEAIDALGAAIEILWTKPKQVPREALRAKKAARLVNREYQKQFAKIVNGEPSSQALKNRELIKRLDWVGARINEAADDLTDGVLKRGY